MPSKVVVGVQWGDEGKGKIIDILAQEAQVVVRAQGGNNAGHTVEQGSEVYKLRTVPSGILYPDTLCLVGSGVVVNPGSLLAEMDGLEARGVSCKNLKIDPRAHVIMPWHPLIDGLAEDARDAEHRIGTTRNGIGPCYMDKAERSGIRMWDLVHEEVFRKKARFAGEEKNRLITRLYGAGPMDLDKIIDEYVAYGKRLADHVEDVSLLVYNSYNEGKKILFEGAQGTLLDLDMGTYPFVTSSHPVAGGFAIGAGVGPRMIDEVIGVAKAYTTRVGEGPFPTELFDDVGQLIRDKGHEYGTVTGRPRRTGWFDAVILRYAVRVNGLTQLAVNKLDTLAGVGDLKVCTAYRLPDGTLLREYPECLEVLADCEPVYETIPGFTEDISGCRSFDELPASCRSYIAELERLCGCRITMVGVGPGRDQNLVRE